MPITLKIHIERYFDRAALQELEEHLGMAELVGSRFGEYFFYWEIAFLVSLGGIECIAGIGRGLGHIGYDEIALGLCAFEF